MEERQSSFHIYGLTLSQRLSIQKKIETLLKEEFPNSRLNIKNNLICIIHEEV